MLAALTAISAVGFHTRYRQHIEANQQLDHLPLERFHHVDHPFSDVSASLDDDSIPHACLFCNGFPPKDTVRAPKRRFFPSAANQASGGM